MEFYGPLIWVALVLIGFLTYLVIAEVGSLGLTRIYEGEGKGPGQNSQFGKFIAWIGFVCGMVLLFVLYVLGVGILSIVLLPS